MTELKKQPQFGSLEDLLGVKKDDRVLGKETVQLINGKNITIPFKSITADEEQAIRKAATRRIRQGNGTFLTEQDEAKYNALIIDAATDTTRTDIRWNSQELANNLDLPSTAVWLTIPKILSLGGIAKATQYIIGLSGIGSTSFDEDVETVKN